MDILSVVVIPDKYVVEINGRIHVHKEFIDLFNEKAKSLENKPNRFDHGVLVDRVLEFARENSSFKNSQVRPYLEQNGRIPSSAIVARVLSKMGKEGLLVQSGDRGLTRWSLAETQQPQ